MRTLTSILLIILSTVAFSQNAPQKVGYADLEYVFSQMPESKQIESQVKTHGEQLQAQLQAKYKEYETKLKAYETGAATMVDAVRRDKETELTQLQENIQKFQTEAQTSLQKKQNDLMDPVFKRISKAIEDVAKENAYSFIINPQSLNGIDILLYSDEKYNISTLVMKKMGITPTATAATQK